MADLVYTTKITANKTVVVEGESIVFTLTRTGYPLPMPEYHDIDIIAANQQFDQYVGVLDYSDYEKVIFPAPPPNIKIPGGYFQNDSKTSQNRFVVTLFKGETTKSFEVFFKKDLKNEIIESFYIEPLGYNGRYGYYNETKGVHVTVLDSLVTSTYFESLPSSEISEGDNIILRLVSTELGQTIFWKIVGINQADLWQQQQDPAAISGSFIVEHNGRNAISHWIRNDVLTEGDELFKYQFSKDSSFESILIETEYFKIKDTSVTPTSTYALTPSATSINEGSTLTTSVATTDVASGTTLYYSLSGTGINTTDFSPGALTGSGTVASNGSFSFSHTLANDLITEGTETLNIKLYSDSSRSTQVGSTASVSIADTSITPTPTYTLTPSATTINEGSTLTTSVATTNVSTGTKLYYALSGTGITTADFSTGVLTGEGITDSVGKFTFSHTLAKDLTTEGAETLSIKLYSDTARTLQVGLTATVSVVDTSELVLNLSAGSINENIVAGSNIAKLSSTDSDAANKLYYTTEPIVIGQNHARPNERISQKLVTEGEISTNPSNSSGRFATAKLTKDGEVFLKGSLDYGGNGSDIYSLSMSNVREVHAVAEGTFVALTKDGNLKSFGNWSGGGAELTDITAISTSASGFLALNKDGNITGKGAYQNSIPTNSSSTKIKAIFAGGYGGYGAIDTSDNFYVWGYGANNLLDTNPLKTIGIGFEYNKIGILFEDNSSQNINASEYFPREFSYNLVSGTGDTDNAVFTIDGNQLKIKASPDYETKNSYSIRLKTTDAAGLSLEKAVTLNVNNINEIPTALNLSASAFNENIAAASVIATLSSTDPDAADTFTYALASGTGDTDNAAFSIVGNQLKIKASPDYETKSSYNIRLKTTDSGGLSLEKAVTLNVNDLDDIPTYTLTPSTSTINEGSTLTTSVATTNVATGTKLYYALSGTGITTADFSVGALTGEGTTDATGKFTFTHTLANDLTTEGTELIEIKLYSDSSRSTQVGSTASVAIADTSIPPAVFSVAGTIVTEGSAATILITRSGNTAIPVDLNVFTSNNNASAGLDYTSISSVLSFNSGENLKSVSINTIDDSSVESSETFNVFISSTNANASISTQSAGVTILDNDFNPIYSITPSTTSTTEGASLTTTINTTYVPNGTTLYWSLSGNGITASDFSSGSLSDGANTGSDGKISFSHAFANDLTTEGAEILNIILYKDSNRSQQIASTAIFINDTSIATTTSNVSTVTNITNNYVYYNSNNTTTNTNSGNTLNAWNTFWVDNSVKAGDIVNQWFGTATSTALQTQDPTESKLLDITTSSWAEKVKINRVAKASDNGDFLEGKQKDSSSTDIVGSVLTGGKGNDSIQAKAGWDMVDGGDGDDLVKTGNGRDILTGGTGRDELWGGFGWNTYKGDKDGFSDLIVIKSDQHLPNPTLGNKSGNNSDGLKTDIIENLDSIDKIIIQGVSTNQITFANATAQGLTGIGIYSKGFIEALYTGGDLSIAQLTAMTTGDISAAVMNNTLTSYGVW